MWSLLHDRESCLVFNFFVSSLLLKQETLYFNEVVGRRPATLFKQETLAQLFSSEFCDVFKRTLFFIEYHWMTSSDMPLKYLFKVSHNDRRTKYAPLKYLFKVNHNNTRAKHGSIVLIFLLLKLIRYWKLLPRRDLPAQS